MTDTQHEAAIEAAATELEEHLPPALMRRVRRPELREHWLRMVAKTIAAYDAARSGERASALDAGVHHGDDIADLWRPEVLGRAARSGEAGEDQIERVAALLAEFKGEPLQPEETNLGDEQREQARTIIRASSGEAEGEKPTRWRDRLLGAANCIHGVRLYRDCAQCAAAPSETSEFDLGDWETYGMEELDIFARSLNIDVDAIIERTGGLTRPQLVAAVRQHFQHPEPRQDQPVDRASGEEQLPEFGRHEAVYVEHPKTDEREITVGERWRHYTGSVYVVKRVYPDDGRLRVTLRRETDGKLSEGWAAYLREHFEPLQDGGEREPWTGKRLFDALLHEGERARNPFGRLSTSGKAKWDALAARIEREIQPPAPRQDQPVDRASGEASEWGACIRCGKQDEEGTFVELLGTPTPDNPDGGTGDPICPECIATAEHPETGERRPRKDAERHIVWLCAGCDECDPQDGSKRIDGPCDGPSKNGAAVVLAEDYDRLREHLSKRARTDEDALDAAMAQLGVGLLSDVFGIIHSQQAETQPRYLDAIREELRKVLVAAAGAELAP